MNFMFEYFLALITLLGIIVGIILTKISPEEILPGRKYFIFVKVLFLFCLAGTLLILGFEHSILYYFLFLLGIITGTFLHWTYMYLGFALAASFSTSYLALIASEIFIFGIPFGTLRKLHKKLGLKKLLFLVLYFSLPFLLLFYFNISPNLIFAFCGGALFVRPISVLHRL